MVIERLAESRNSSSSIICKAQTLFSESGFPLAKTCATWLQRTVTLSTVAANSVQAAAERKQYTGDFQLGGVYMAETPSSINVLKTGNNYRISNVINPRKPLSQSSSQGRLENLHQSITSLNQHMEAQS